MHTGRACPSPGAGRRSPRRGRRRWSCRRLLGAARSGLGRRRRRRARRRRVGREQPPARRRAGGLDRDRPGPGGVTLTAQGSAADVGETATVACEPRPGPGRRARHHGDRAREGADRRPSPAGSSTTRRRRSTPYFVHVDGDERRRRATSADAPVPLYLRRRRATRCSQASTFTSVVRAVPEPAAARRSSRPATRRRRLPGLPRRPTTASSTAVSFRPDPGLRRRSPGRARVEPAAEEADRSPASASLARPRRRRTIERMPLTLGPLVAAVDTPVVLAPMAASPTRRTAGCAPSRAPGLYVCEMITSPRPGRARRDDPEDAGLRRARDDPLGPALRHRPGRTSARPTEILCAEYGVAPRRPQLRLPGAQGDPQGRRRGAAVEARPARRDPRARRSPPPTPYGVPVTMKTRKGIDDDHLTYLDAGRIAQESGLRRDRAARPHRRAGLLRRRPTGTRSPRSSSTSTSRCSATATSGRPATRCGWSSRPAPPASSSAAAASAGRGCSATSPPPSPATPTVATLPDPRRGARR